MGPSVSQYAVLRALALGPDATSAELARRCFITRQSLGQMVSVLADRGWVVVAEGVGRSRPIRLTAAGRGKVRAAERRMTEVEDRMVSGFSAAQRAELVGLPQGCIDNLC